MNNYVITIARGFGSGGKEIAQKLSKTLDIPYFDNQILLMASNNSGINKDLFFQVNEKLRGHGLIKKLKSYKGNDEKIEPKSKKFVSDDNLYNIQSEIIKELSKHQSCIIVGKCANYLLKENNNVISLYVEASRNNCVNTVIDRLGVNEEEANKMISETDKYRSSYYKYYTCGKKWIDPCSYDLTINTGRINRDKSVQLIIEYAKIKFGSEILN